MGTAALGALAVGIGAGSAPAVTNSCAGEDRAVQSPQDVPAARAAVLCLIDIERRSRGLPPVVSDDRLQQSAQAHSQDMVSRNYFAHTAPEPSPNGSEAHDRARSAGYDVQLVRENLAGGLPVPRDLVLGWLASEHHCEHLLDPDVADIGLGIVAGEFDGTPGPAWTMVVGIETSGLPPDADGRPSAGCPYQSLGTGQPPADPPAQPQATPAAASPAPAAAPKPAAKPKPKPKPAPVAAKVPVGPVLPKAGVRGLRVKWVDGLLQVTGHIRPAVAGHRLVVRVLRNGRRARLALRSKRNGRFAALMVVRPDEHGGTVKVTVSGVPGQLSTFTAKAALPRTTPL